MRAFTDKFLDLTFLSRVDLIIDNTQHRKIRYISRAKLLNFKGIFMFWTHEQLEAILIQMSICFANLERKNFWKNFQEHDFLRDLKFPPLLRCYVAGKKRAGFSNHIKNSALESCTNIFFLLDLTVSTVKRAWNEFHFSRIFRSWVLSILSKYLIIRALFKDIQAKTNG